MIDRRPLERNEILPLAHLNKATKNLATIVRQPHASRPRDNRLIGVLWPQDIHPPMCWPVTTAPEDIRELLGCYAKAKSIRGRPVEC